MQRTRTTALIPRIAVGVVDDELVVVGSGPAPVPQVVAVDVACGVHQPVLDPVCRATVAGRAGDTGPVQGDPGPGRHARGDVRARDIESREVGHGAGCGDDGLPDTAYGARAREHHVGGAGDQSGSCRELHGVRGLTGGGVEARGHLVVGNCRPGDGVAAAARGGQRAIGEDDRHVHPTVNRAGGVRDPHDLRAGRGLAPERHPIGRGLRAVRAGDRHRDRVAAPRERQTRRTARQRVARAADRHHRHSTYGADRRRDGRARAVAADDLVVVGARGERGRQARDRASGQAQPAQARVTRRRRRGVSDTGFQHRERTPDQSCEQHGHDRRLELSQRHEDLPMPQSGGTPQRTNTADIDTSAPLP